MDFIKKNWSNFLFAGFLLFFFFVPGVREFIQRPFLTTPSLDKEARYGDLQNVDFDIPLKGINMPDAHLSDFKGKPIFLNFWGSWCPPCRTEFPTIQELYDKQKDKMNFVLIAMQDKEEKVREFIEKNNYTTPVYMIDVPLPEKLEFSVFPTTFIIDKNGAILKKDQGAANWNADEVHNFIKNLD